MAFAFFVFLFLLAVSDCFEPQDSLFTSPDLSVSSLLTEDFDRPSDGLIYDESPELSSEAFSTPLIYGDDGTSLGDLAGLPWDNGGDESPLIFANSNDACHLSRLRTRGEATSCVNPEDSSGGTNSNSGPDTPPIDPKLLQYIDVESMELKEICPSQPHIPYSIAVCSSPDKEDIQRYPLQQTWVLTHAQRSK